jgi:hypothetical protein
MRIPAAHPKRHPARAAASGAALLVLAACSARSGVGTVGPGTSGIPAAIAATPQLSVGTTPGDPNHELAGVVTPFLLPDGRLVVPLRDARVLRIFQADGSFQASFGGAGGANGQFSSLDGAWARDDTLEAFDRELKRITRFLTDGSTEVVTFSRPQGAEVPIPRPLSDGWAVFGIRDASVGGRDQLSVYHFDRSGTNLGESARAEGMARLPSPSISGPDPLSPRARFAVYRDEVYAAETTTAEIRVFDLAGNPVRRLPWAAEVPTTPEVAYRAVIDAAVAGGAPEDAQRIRERLEGFPVRDRVSLFWEFLVDDLGFIWIRPFEAGQHSLWLGGAGIGGAGPGGEWLVLSPSGEPVGSIEVPAGIEPAQITADAVVGIRHDPDDRESVHVHRLVRR